MPQLPFMGSSVYLWVLLPVKKTGRGQYIDVSYTDGVMVLIGSVPSVSEYLLSGRVPKRGEGLLGGAYNYYETRDGGYIALGCIEHHFWYETVE